MRIPDTDDQKEELELFLDQRRTLLNWMYQETPQEVARMNQLNARLFDLTNRLRVKMADVCESIASHQRDDFDDMSVFLFSFLLIIFGSSDISSDAAVV